MCVMEYKDPSENIAAFECGDGHVELYGEEKSISINEETIYYREGLWLEKTDDGTYEQDDSIVWFYKDRTYPEDYVYFENGTVEAAVRNFINIHSQNHMTE